MTIRFDAMNRRHVVAGIGATALTAASGWSPALAADVTIRQGYQTNIWGMPTYYLMKSGYLEKRGLKTQDFAVPSGNLTMQQMVARQVDMGTYAGPSLLIGHDTSIDLHTAVELLERGCPMDAALQILF